MGVDREQKRKRKREEKRKVRRRELDRIARRGKEQDLDFLAYQDLMAGNHRSALALSIKRLKMETPSPYAWEIAVMCARKLGETSTLFTLLRQAWEQGRLVTKLDCLQLGELAFQNKSYALAQEVFRQLEVKSTPLLGQLPKAARKQVAEYLRLCRLLLLEFSPKSAVGSSSASSAHRGDDSEAALTAAPVGNSQGEEETRQTKETEGEGQPELQVAFETDGEPVLAAVRNHEIADRAALDLAMRAYKLSFLASYDQILSLASLRNVQSFWYQEETARKVMKAFRGRAILADEVGLGKTIEAGLVLKEYLARGLVRSVLILAPSSLVDQWDEELRGKFDLRFTTSNHPLARQDPERFWREDLILCSIQTARTNRHFDPVTSRSYDLVIVDEAHHLKNRTTLNWKLVNAIQKNFLLLLTATPVQNKLEELYNLVTLLKPGHLRTLRAFKEEFVSRGNPTDPRNREKLRDLLKEVMIRNTRSVTQLRLPPRFAYTTSLSPSRKEVSFYQGISSFVAEHANLRSVDLPKLTLRKLLEAAGSSPKAAIKMLERIAERTTDGSKRRVNELLDLGRNIGTGIKTQKVIDLIHASSQQKIVFVNYLSTLEHLHHAFLERDIAHVVFHSSLTAGQKQSVMEQFRNGAPVLLSTGAGGEGHNLQFCQVMVNYDLPWNPMQIEQRIGRIHRIGQEKEVHVYNFCALGSIEDHILEVLDRKINMFELVVGEIDMILGRLQGEQEFSDLVYEIWVQHTDETERRIAFGALASRLKRAKTAYEKSKDLDEKLFQQDFGV
ncbi:MAG: DEAD/DEAH box helicase [Deltaproteobacteria bacterium]|nr:DEAD/DEAH box helicase [Deltaproteobacteria bacterium]